MKNTNAIILILGGLSGLWLYNTGRLQAIGEVVRDPSYLEKQRQKQTGAAAAQKVGAAGGVDPAKLIACATSFDVSCIDDIFAAVSDPFDTLKDIGNIFTAPFGIRL